MATFAANLLEALLVRISVAAFASGLWLVVLRLVTGAADRLLVLTVERELGLVVVEAGLLPLGGDRVALRAGPLLERLAVRVLVAVDAGPLVALGHAHLGRLVAGDAGLSGVFAFQGGFGSFAVVEGELFRAQVLGDPQRATSLHGDVPNEYCSMMVP